VVHERLDRLARHRVDGLGPDQRLDVQEVGVVGVLRGGGGPQAALRRRALALQLLPLAAGEDLLVGLVGELGVGDRELALELLRAAGLLEALVGLGVHAGDEERRDRRDAARVAAAVDEPAQAAQVGLGDLAVALEREDQRHVDRDAGRDRLLDRRQALGRGGDLDEEVGPVDQPVQAPGLLDRGLGLVREVRVDLEGDPAVAAAALVVDAAQLVAGGADVVAREREEDLLRVGLAARDQLAELVVVGVALGDGALEDGGVGGDALDALVDQRAEVAVLHEGAREVVDPRALAVLRQLMELGRCHGAPSARYFSVSSHETVPASAAGKTAGVREPTAALSGGGRRARAARRRRPARCSAPRGAAPRGPGSR
jgi:hypothetical protein